MPTLSRVEHTPTPWRTLADRPLTVVAQIGTEWVATVFDGHPRKEGVPTANAAFIVRAVNNFDPLLEALEAGIQWWTHATDCGQVHCKLCDKADAATDAARDALKAARA